jgi:hypothetical protein
MKPIVIITVQNGLVRHIAASGSMDVYVHDLDVRKGFETAPQEVDVETHAQLQQRVTNAGLASHPQPSTVNLQPV